MDNEGMLLPVVVLLLYAAVANIIVILIIGIIFLQDESHFLTRFLNQTRVRSFLKLDITFHMYMLHTLTLHH